MDKTDDVPLISIEGYALSHEDVMRMAKEVEDELLQIRKELGYMEQSDQLRGGGIGRHYEPYR